MFKKRFKPVSKDTTEAVVKKLEESRAKDGGSGETKPEKKPEFKKETHEKTYPEPKGLPLEVVESLNKINMKLDTLIKKDEEVHKKIESPAESNLAEVEAEAKRISKEEGVVQHVNRVSDGKYKLDNFYDAERTEVSYENGLKKE